MVTLNKRNMSYSCKSLIVTDSEVAACEKRLSICLLAGGFSFSELTTSGTLLTFGEAEGHHASSMTAIMADVKAFFSQIGIRPLGYASIEIIVLSDHSTWIPDELYSSTENRQYLKLVGSNATSIMAAACPSLQSTAVFATNDALATAFKVALPGATVINQHVRFASTPYCRRSNDHPVLLAHWRPGRIDFAAYRAGTYIFGNTIPYSNDSEALFHTVEIIKTVGLEAPDCELLLCGDVDRQRFALLRPYFPTASLFTGLHSSQLNPAFKTLHTYRHALIL